MIAEVHYTDDHLIAMLEGGDEQAIARNQHLASCATCRQSLDEYRSIVRVLADEAPWDRSELKDEPDPSTVATLRAFATSMQREDEEAETYVAALLEGARETWMPRLRAHPEWRTAGVVRRLAAASYPALDKMPPDAVEITNLAIEIAEHLVPGAYVSDTVARLRGAAWRERAYALFFVGRFHESLAACDRADAAFSECVVDEYDRARVAVIRALSLGPFDRLAEAASLATAAIKTFSGYADEARFVSASISAVHVQFKARDYKGALASLLRLSDGVGQHGDESLRALIAANLGFCYRELGNSEAALAQYALAASIHDANKSDSESARVRWNIAGLLTALGRTDEALAMFAVVRTEFDRLSMESEYVIAGLEVAELLLLQNRFEVAESVCREISARIEIAGLSNTSRALAAVGFLQEAMRSRRATVKLVRHVHDYVRRLPEEPNLLFAPPLL